MLATRISRQSWSGIFDRTNGLLDTFATPRFAPEGLDTWQESPGCCGRS
jgi:hypothetical protein